MNVLTETNNMSLLSRKLIQIKQFGNELTVTLYDTFEYFKVQIKADKFIKTGNKLTSSI